MALNAGFQPAHTHLKSRPGLANVLAVIGWVESRIQLIRANKLARPGPHPGPLSTKLIWMFSICLHFINFPGPNKKAQGADQLPRILSCGHTFCDKCIQTRLITQAEDDSQEPVYQAICPYETCKVEWQSKIISMSKYKLILTAFTMMQMKLKNLATGD